MEMKSASAQGRADGIQGSLSSSAEIFQAAPVSRPAGFLGRIGMVVTADRPGVRSPSVRPLASLEKAMF